MVLKVIPFEETKIQKKENPVYHDEIFSEKKQGTFNLNLQLEDLK